VLSNFSRHLRALGWRAALVHVVARLISGCSAGRARLVPYYLVAQPVGDRPASSSQRESRITFLELNAGSSLLAQAPRPAHVIQQRLSSGAHCFAASQDDALLGFVWIKEGEYLEDEVRCRYVLRSASASSVWDFDVYVAPQYRFGRLFGRLWDFVNAQLHSRGHQWSFSRISLFNPASLAAHERLGARRYGFFAFLIIGRVQISFGSVPPHFHLSLGEDSYPTLVLGPSPRDQSRSSM